jgi:ABC-type lipoprotein release transport system permease subunit
MSVINFKYLGKKRVFALIIILTLTSALFSITTYSFLGFYNGFSGYVGERSDVVAVYSRVGSTPFTGVVPLALADNITALNGVIAVSPEAIAPCTINGQSVFVRGIIPQDLKSLDELSFLDGQNLNLTDINSVILGKNIANRLHLGVGDKILVFGVLSKLYVELQVGGVFQSNSTLNDEALVPLYVGQWLRSLSYNDVTFIRAKINLSQINAAQIYPDITRQTEPPTTALPKGQTQQELQAILPLLKSNVDVNVIGVEQSQKLMQSYLDRYGVSKDTLIILSILVLFFASSTATCAITLFVKQHIANIAIILAVGATQKKVRLDLALKMVFWALLATLIGTAISAVVISVFQNFGYLQVLSHSIVFQLDPAIIAANFLLLASLICVNIARMELKQ